MGTVLGSTGVGAAASKVGKAVYTVSPGPPLLPGRMRLCLCRCLFIYFFCRVVVLFCSPFRLRSLLLYLARTVKLSGDCEHAQMLWAKLRRAVHPSWGGMAGGSAGGPDDTSRFALLGDRVPTKQLGKLGVKGQEAGRCSRVGKEKKRTD